MKRVNILAKSASLGGEQTQLEKREEIQFERKSKELTIFMSFMDIFPVSYEFLPHFPLICQT